MNRADELRRHLADAHEAIRKGIALLEGSGAAAPPEGSVEGVLAGMVPLVRRDMACEVPVPEAWGKEPDPGSLEQGRVVEVDHANRTLTVETEDTPPREMPQELKDLLAGPDDEPDEGIMAREPTRREHPDAGIVVEHLPPEYGEP